MDPPYVPILEEQESNGAQNPDYNNTNDPKSNQLAAHQPIPVEAYARFFRGYGWKLTGALCLSVGFMPVAYFLGQYRCQRAILAMVGLQGCAGMAVQLSLARSVETFILDCAGAPYLEAVVRAPRIPYSCFGKLFIQRWIIKFVCAIPDFYDPVTDAATAGGAEGLLSTAADEAFVDSTCAPFANLGLKGTLTLIVLLATFWELLVGLGALSFLPSRTLQLEQAKDAHTELAVSASCWSIMAKTSECASLGFLGGLLGSVADATREEGIACGANHVSGGGNTFIKLSLHMVETLPCVWFTTSLLGLSLHFMPPGSHDGAFATHLTTASIVLSLVCFVRTIAGAWQERAGISICPDSNGTIWMKTIVYAALGVNCLCAALLLLRFLMIRFGCESYNFSISTFQCEAW